MKIKDFLKHSLIDYSGIISSVIFTPNCNYNCPACHAKYILNNKDLIDEKIFFEYLDSRREWIDAVVLCGGEPTLENGLESFLKRIKDETGLKIKLDTNGSNPSVLEDLLEKDLIDYVAMDVKGPEEIYSNIVGKNIDIEKIKESMRLVQKFPDYEFRITVVPIIRNKNPEEISFMTSEEIEKTAKMIYDNTQNSFHKYYLQKFVPIKDGLLDSKLERFSETPGEILKEGLKNTRKYLLNTKIRGEN